MGAPTVGVRPGGRRVYPCAQVANVEAGTDRYRAASAMLYSGVSNRSPATDPAICRSATATTLTLSGIADERRKSSEFVRALAAAPRNLGPMRAVTIRDGGVLEIAEHPDPQP